MARKRVVSRTITTTIATAMVCDVLSATVATKKYTVSLKLDEEQALKEVKRLYETNTLKIVAIQDLEYNEQLYSMPEIDFLKYANPVNADEADEAEEDGEVDEVDVPDNDTKKKSRKK